MRSTVTGIGPAPTASRTRWTASAAVGTSPPSAADSPAAEQPAVVRPGRQQGARRVRVGDPVDAEPVRPGHLPQRPPQLDHRAAEHPLAAGHRDPEGRPHGAAGAVGSHQVPGRHRTLPRRAAQPGAHATRRKLLEAHQLGAELDPGRREGSQVVQQHPLEVVLRHAGRWQRAGQGALVAGRVAHVVRRPVGDRRQRLGEAQPPLHLDGAGQHLLLQAPGPQQLHRPGADHRRARQVRDRVPALDDQHRGAEPGQGHRRGQAGRPGADHQHRKHLSGPCESSPIPSDKVSSTTTL